MIGKIDGVNGDMLALDYPDGRLDLIWYEGAIFIKGFESGLHKWRRTLTRVGYMAVSELSWLRNDPPEEVRKFFAEAYPGWWDNYYDPIAAKMSSLRAKYHGDSET